QLNLLVASLARPGGNATGFTNFESDGIFECDVVPDFPTTGDNRLAIKNPVALGPRHDNPITFSAQIRHGPAFGKSDRLHVCCDRFTHIKTCRCAMVAFESAGSASDQDDILLRTCRLSRKCCSTIFAMRS